VDLHQLKWPQYFVIPTARCLAKGTVGIFRAQSLLQLETGLRWNDEAMLLRGMRDVSMPMSVERGRAAAVDDQTNLDVL
jgi:hypothetical protein